MSAVYLHNALYHPEVQETRSNFPHSRNLSTISSATLQTNTTLHSQPHEPLLPHNSAPQDSYYDPLSQTTRPHFVPHVTHEYEFGDGSVLESEKARPSPLRRRPMKKMDWLKLAFEAVIILWALYNAVRYFWAFTIYESDTGETASLALGICTGLSFAFAACAFILSSFRSQLLRYDLPTGVVSVTYWTLIYISLFLLFTPSAANFAFIFVWRHASDLQLRPMYRCHIDIDLVWSKSAQLCQTNTVAWGVWVALSSVRVALTLAAILGYLLVLLKVKQKPNIRPKRIRGKHRINTSDLLPSQSVLPPATGIPFPATPSPLLQSQPHRQSDSSISSRTRVSNYRPRLARSHSSGLSAKARSMSEVTTSTPIMPEVPQQLLAIVTEDDTASDGFTSLVSQIDRETDAAVEFARSEESSSQRSQRTAGSAQEGSFEEQEGPSRHTQNQPTNYEDDDDDDFYNGNRTPALGFNEFGQPYPPEEDIPMLNGYIRRMPTIESMGSREMGSSVAGSSLFAKDRGSMLTHKSHSRPPTRNARASWVGSELTGSEPSSRTNSLSVQVEKLAAMGFLGMGGGSSSGHGHASEMGELFDPARKVAYPGVPESPLGKMVFNLSVPSSTNGSRSTDVSYVTAVMTDGEEEEKKGEVGYRPPSPQLSAPSSLKD